MSSEGSESGIDSGEITTIPIPKRIFIGGISNYTTEEELVIAFQRFGSVTAVKISEGKTGNVAKDKRYGFITFAKVEEARSLCAKVAARTIPPIIISGRCVRISPAMMKTSVRSNSLSKSFKSMKESTRSSSENRSEVYTTESEMSNSTDLPPTPPAAVSYSQHQYSDPHHISVAQNMSLPRLNSQESRCIPVAEPEEAHIHVPGVWRNVVNYRSDIFPDTALPDLGYPTDQVPLTPVSFFQQQEWTCPYVTYFPPVETSGPRINYYYKSPYMPPAQQPLHVQFPQVWSNQLGLPLYLLNQFQTQNYHNEN